MEGTFVIVCPIVQEPVTNNLKRIIHEPSAEETSGGRSGSIPRRLWFGWSDRRRGLLGNTGLFGHSTADLRYQSGEHAAHNPPTGQRDDALGREEAEADDISIISPILGDLDRLQRNQDSERGREHCQGEVEMELTRRSVGELLELGLRHLINLQFGQQTDADYGRQGLIAW
jgi:hypothetical protein